jgi:hypothetical protein
MDGWRMLHPARSGDALGVGWAKLGGEKGPARHSRVRVVMASDQFDHGLRPGCAVALLDESVSHRFATMSR